MAGERKSLVGTIREWWAVVGIFVAIVGGYVWLESEYAKVQMLEEQRNALQQAIEDQRAEFESQLRGKECELQYTIAYQQTDNDIKEDEALIEDLQRLLPSLDDPTPRASEDRRVIGDTIDSAQKRYASRLKSLACLSDKRGNCVNDSTVDIAQCHYLNF